MRHVLSALRRAEESASQRAGLDSVTASGLTRRGALVAGASAVGGLATAGRTRAQSADWTLTVATRNCYLGANLFRLLAAASGGQDAVEAAVGDLLHTVDRSHVSARLDAVAAELERTDPGLVGIQEAPLIRTGEPTAGTTPTATDVRYDFRERLSSALADRGLPYRVVSGVETTDFQLPATVEGERRAVRLTDRDLILAHERVPTTNETTGRFDAAVTLSGDDRSVSVQRGYGIVEASVGDHRVTFCNTHLESASAETRLQQARELESLLADRREPVVLVGDLNSGPGESPEAYDRLTSTFRDAAAGVGTTCCHAADLRTDEVSLTARVDHVLVRGDLRATATSRVGATPANRVAVDGDRLWPSDHAGVVATLAPGAASTATETTRTAAPETTATATRASTATKTPESSGADIRGDDTTADLPGFGALPAAAAVVVTALARRRSEGD